MNDAMGKPRLDAVVPINRLQVTIKPRALDLSVPAVRVPLQSVPPGRYAVIIIQFTGQTWRLPNELQPSVASSVGITPVESQAFTIVVP